MNIYVSNLGFNVQNEDLRELFTSYGEVTSAKIIMDRETGRSRGFGFVEMSDSSSASTAISQLNETQVEGRTIRVTEARPKEEGTGGNRSGGFNGGRKNFENRW